MTGHEMDLSIIVINWNSIEFTRDCLESIQATTPGLKYEVIVVDNASEDECASLSSRFPWIKLVLSDRNLGFAGANNLGVDHSCGRAILFLNPDTVVAADALPRMLRHLNSSPEVGAVGGRLLNRDLTLQMSCVQPFPTICNQLFSIDWLKRRWPMFPLWGVSALFSESRDGIQEVEVVSGACLMVKRTALERIGRFSTEYFMYAEEMDLCYKLRQAGYKICHVGEAEVVHFGGQSTKKKRIGFSDILMRESVFKLLRKFRGNLYAQLYRTGLFLSAAARLAMLLPLLALAPVIPNRDDVVGAFRKWRLIARWSLSLERWTREVGSSEASPTVVKP
jgi:N-acetylglucosaminyl-diphospho-decaprenol L-rhamnosyltransferase